MKRHSIAAAVAMLAALLTPIPAQASPGSDAIERAQSWAEAGVGYSGSNYFTNEYGSYRTDCSGYVSMAWGLGSSYTTVTLPNVSYPIAKDALEPGDILNNPLPGTSGHVVLFAGWADVAQTRYFAYEESPSGGAQLNEIPYPYWPGYGTFTPRRYIATSSKAPIPAPEPKVRTPKPDPVADGDLVRNDKQVYRIAGGAAVPVSADRPARKLSDAEFEELPNQPADGTLLRAKNEIYVIAGGAPVLVPRGTLDAADVVTVERTVIDEYLPQQPADGTIVRTDEGQRYVFAGGAPIHMTPNWWKALRPKPSVITVAQKALDLAGGLNGWSHVRNVPVDGTLLKAGADVYLVQDGVPVPHEGVRGVPIDPAAIKNAGGEGPWSHLGS